MSTALKRVHDRLLADRPTDAKHDALSCPFCLMDSIDEGGLRADAQPGGDDVSDKTYSQADLEAAIAKAVAVATAPLQSRLEEIAFPLPNHCGHRREVRQQGAFWLAAGGDGIDREAAEADHEGVGAFVPSDPPLQSLHAAVELL